MIGPCPGRMRAGDSAARRSSDVMYTRRPPPQPAGIITVVPRTTMSPGVEIAAGGIPEAHVIDGVTGRVDGGKRGVAGDELLTVGERGPVRLA